MRRTRARILLVDDDTLHLEIFSEWLTACGYVVVMASSGEAALALIRPGAFDVALIDLKMPGISGLELMELLKDRDPSLEVIFLTGSGNLQDAIAALRHGKAFDFLLKPVQDLRMVNQVIEQALEKRYMVGSAPHAPPSRPSFIASFTPRERDILGLLVKGWDNMQIAHQLALSEKTVRNALTVIYEKLQVTSRAQAIVACLQFGLGGQ